MQQNVKLQPLSPFVGEWRLLGTHPYLPNRTLHGQATFEWLEGGAFLIWRMHIEESEIPDGIAVFGTDDESTEGAMIYFDVRGVSREYRWTISGNEWRWFRSRC